MVVGGLILARFAFEFTVVGQIALVSEQAPAHREKMMTLAAAAALLGSSAAGLVGPWVYDQFQATGLSLVSTAIAAVCLLLIVLFVREKTADSPV